ncbi:hypothetical protein [Jannaschia pohangensis]|uniref:Response regulatory domain-containing protein n=1 Tax=Jannaschia pohangensis TaxID=390807 RepID=A0A1I3M3H8_9RHOB|nr:hypothetical protein [Jannaschia pohangensis]SFI91574.1 hypothetical protein SAMN04488095_1721 [Jannaschia pohangensis]
MVFLALLAGEGLALHHADSQDDAALLLCDINPLVVVIHLDMTDGSPLAVADFCNYRRPGARLILLGGGQLMTDGTLFRHVGNAHALISGRVSAADLTSLVVHHAAASVA